MSGYAEAHPAGRVGPLPYELEDWRWADHRYRAPLPVKVLAVVTAFWLFHPLGVALLVYFLWRAARGNGGCAFRGADFGRPWNRTRSSGRWGRPASNTAFEERRRETLRELNEEAEAFDSFERKLREARDREAFERFMAERNAPKGEQGSN